MKKLRDLKQRICSFENLLAAYKAAAKDKRYRSEVNSPRDHPRKEKRFYAIEPQDDGTVDVYLSPTTSKKDRLCVMYKSYTGKGRNHLSKHYEQEILDLPDKPEDTGRKDD